MWCDDDTIKPYFIKAGRNIAYGNLKRQLQSPCFCGFAEKIKKSQKKLEKSSLTFTRLSYYNNQVSSRENKNNTAQAGAAIVHHEFEYGILAQLGEHLPYKQRVIGSSPIGPIHKRIWRDSSVG